MVQHHFQIGDYVVFGTTVCISIAIGIFYAFSGGGQKTTSEYLVGGRAMSFVPTAVSLIVSFESSIMMLGIPAESYVYGIQKVWWAVGLFAAQLMSIQIIVPLLHPLGLTSAFEYLEYRFNSKAVRILGTIFGMLNLTWYMGIVLYGPAVALKAVTGFPLWSSTFVIALVAVIYTSIGGIKAVIWTDVFQASVMLMGIFALLIKGTMESGGPKEVWDIAQKGGRLNFFNFDPDPTVRHTFWCLFFGAFIRGFGMGFNQSTVQRVSSTKSVGEAKRMCAVAAPAFLVSLCLALYEGVVAYAYYVTKQCDPLESKQITNPNQIVPFMVMDIFENLPGMPGLFLASLFSASLSTLSSGLASVAAVLWTDILHPLLGDISETKATLVTKMSVVILGAVATGIALLVSKIGGTLTQIAGSLISAFAGPTTGLFFLGCFFPRANAKGTFIGGLVGFSFSVWISMGMNFSPAVKQTPFLPPAPTDQCPNPSLNITDGMYGMTTYITNTTTTTITTTSFDHSTETNPDGESLGIHAIYNLSYMWISAVGIFGTIIVGYIASFITGMNKPGEVDPRYLLSMSDTLLICFPRCLKSRLSKMGQQFMDPKYKDNFPEPRHLFSSLKYEVNICSILETENKNEERSGQTSFTEISKITASNTEENIKSNGDVEKHDNQCESQNHPSGDRNVIC